MIEGGAVDETPIGLLRKKPPVDEVDESEEESEDERDELVLEMIELVRFLC